MRGLLLRYKMEDDGTRVISLLRGCPQGVVVRGPKGYYVEILVFQFASSPGDSFVRHKQLQCCLLLCLRAVSITLGWCPPTRGRSPCSHSPLRFVFAFLADILGLMPKDNPFMLSPSISYQVQLKTHLRGQFGDFTVNLEVASMNCCKMLQ